MTPTVFLALLTHQTGMGTVGLVEGSAAVSGRPLHLSLHTDREAAEEALEAAMRQEWDHPALGHAGLSYSFGPSADWKPASLWREAHSQGYCGTVTEEPVELSE
jgi:hypothetical protein